MTDTPLNPDGVSSAWMLASRLHRVGADWQSIAEAVITEYLDAVAQPEVNSDKASAWDEGFQAGWEEHESPGAFVNDVWDAETPNPYNKEDTK